MGSYAKLIDILRERRQEAEDDKARDPVACPYDGTPLETHRNILHCPNGDFQQAVGAGRPLVS